MPDLSPILIAGPTASGKSALALQLAQWSGGWIINADALQVYDCWQWLSARPDAGELAQAPHHLYGHIGYRTPYSVGHWLRELSDVLDQARAAGACPIIVGGTGLYFSALTEGMADIPEVPQSIRDAAMAMEPGALLSDLRAHDPDTAARIDTDNPVRVQRAWEVLQATGTGLAAWQDDTPAPILPAGSYTGVVLESDRDWLIDRIERRFDQMIESGALNEVRAVLDLGWDPTLPASKAIGAQPLIDHLQGECSLPDAIALAKVQTRQYAKRQRSWFRNRMKSWRKINLSTDYPQGLSQRDVPEVFTG